MTGNFQCRPWYQPETPIFKPDSEAGGLIWVEGHNSYSISCW